MARGPRLDYAGAWHHVMNRGARRAPIFGNDECAGAFLRVVGEAALAFDLEVHAYCVMPNHYHLLVRSVRGNLSRAMQRIGAGFVQDMNRLYHWDGPMMRGRFRSQLIGNEDYLLTVASYIHLNPLRANLVRRLDQHCWTSHRAYLGLDVPPEWLSREFVWSLAGGQEAFAEFVASLRMGRASWPEDLNQETGWQRRDPMPRHSRPSTIRDRRLAASVPDAEAVLERVEKITGVSRREILTARSGRGANPARRYAVWALAESTRLTCAQIGKELGMTEGHVSKTLRRWRESSGAKLSSWIAAWHNEGRRRNV